MSSENSARHYNVDVGRMIDMVLAIPEHMRRAWEFSEEFAGKMKRRPPRIVVCGMGGSSISGQLLRDLLGPGGATSVHIERGYALPAFAGKDTPVVCISYSGNTEETLAMYREAARRGCPLFVIASGGALIEEAAAAGSPALTVPGGLPPRAAIGYLFTPLLRMAAVAGLLEMDEKKLGSALEGIETLLATCRPDSDLADNSALHLAKRLYGKMPVVYSGDGLLAGAGYRWKCQFNENSKSMAFHNTFPELGHNEIMAWDCPAKMRQDTFLIMLRDVDDHDRVRKNMDAAYAILEPLAGSAVAIDSLGAGGPAGRLSRLLSTVVMADLTSVYLAVEYGRDPTPIGKIEQIKEKLGSEDE